MSTLIEDEKLAQLAQRGDQRAFVDLIERHQRAIYSLCYRMTGNAADAEDLTQETFLRFYSSLRRLRPGSPLRPWLHKIATNVTLDALRKRKFSPPLALESDEGAPPEVADDGPTPEEVYLVAERRSAVQRALLELPADHRIALVLFYLEGLSYREIAETLGISQSTLEARLFRARKSLAALLRPRLADWKDDGRKGREDADAMRLVR